MDGFSVLLKYFPPPAFKCCLSLRGCTGTCVTALSFQPETGSNSRLSKEKKKKDVGCASPQPAANLRPPFPALCTVCTLLVPTMSCKVYPKPHDFKGAISSLPHPHPNSPKGAEHDMGSHGPSPAWRGVSSAVGTGWMPRA